MIRAKFGSRSREFGSSLFREPTDLCPLDPRLERDLVVDHDRGRRVTTDLMASWSLRLMWKIDKYSLEIPV